MTTSAAENLAGRAGEKDKEKVEKRRALGRGLESLLPGPRVVPGGVGQSGGAASSRFLTSFGMTRSLQRPLLWTKLLREQILFNVSPDQGSLDQASVRDRSEVAPGDGQIRGEAVPGTIRAVAEEGGSRGWSARATRDCGIHARGTCGSRAALGWTAGGGCPHIQYVRECPHIYYARH